MFRSRRVSRLAAVSAVALLLGVALLAFALWKRTFAPRDRDDAAEWEAIVTTLAGDGVAGVRDGEPFRARFSDPFGVAAGPDGSIYVADAGEAQRVRRIAPDGSVSTIAGSEGGFADGAGTSARFNTPSALARGPHGIIYVADTGNNAIRQLTVEGAVSTLAGDGTAGYRDGPGRLARFDGPIGVTVDAAQRVIVADSYNDRVRAIDRAGNVVTLAGDGQPGYQDGAAAQARFNTPCGVAVDAAGNIYVADTGNGLIRVISTSGVVRTIWDFPPGGLHRPTGIAVGDGAAVYTTDERGRVVEIVPGVGARVLAGSSSGFTNGAGADARFRAPSGLALLAPARLVVTDRRNTVVRLVAAASQLEFRAPPPPLDPTFDRSGRLLGPLLWPFAPFEGPYEITGTLGEARGSESERFHAGLDIHAPEGTTVHAIRPAVVSDPIAASDFAALHESLRVGPLAYVHLRVGRGRRNELFEDPRFVHTYDEEQRLVHVRVRRGTRFNSGEAIGTVNAFSHVHLNVGWSGEEINPLAHGLVYFEDTIRPTIARNGIRLYREDGQPLTERRNGRMLVSGRVSIVVDAWDQVDGNARRRRLGLYRLGYQILYPDGTAAPGFETARETVRFDRLAPDPDAPRLVYAPGSGIPVYGRRSTHFLYVVTNTLRGGVASPGAWDADALPPGDYILRILAADIRGNEAAANRDLLITITDDPFR
jgi:sugar lactone lactonase YvrE